MIANNKIETDFEMFDCQNCDVEFFESNPHRSTYIRNTMPGEPSYEIPADMDAADITQCFVVVRMEDDQLTIMTTPEYILRIDDAGEIDHAATITVKNLINNATEEQACFIFNWYVIADENEDSFVTMEEMHSAVLNAAKPNCRFQ